MADLTLEISPPWGADDVGVLVMLDDSGAPLLPAPVRFEGRGPIPFDAAVEGPFRLWAEAFVADRAPGLAIDCALSYSDGEDLPRGTAYASPLLELGGKDLPLASTEEGRPLALRSRCPERPSICERVRLSEEQPLGNLVSLHSVAAVSPGRYLIGGVDERTLAGVLGSLESDHFQPYDLAGQVDLISQISWRSGIGGWASTNGGQVVQLDADAGVARQLGVVGAQATILDDDAGYFLDAGGGVRRLTVTSTGPSPRLGTRSGLLKIKGAGGLLYGHDLRRLEAWDGDRWRMQTGPNGVLGEGEMSVRGERLTLFTPTAGIFVREAPDQPWGHIPSDFGPVLGGWWRDGLLLVVGAPTRVGLWDGDRWCYLPVDTSRVLRAVAFSADEGEAVLVGTSYAAAGASLVLHLSIDPP